MAIGEICCDELTTSCNALNRVVVLDPLENTIRTFRT